VNFPLTFTQGLALYGAIMSTILLGWSIYRGLTDKGRLYVHCYIGKLIGGQGKRDENDYLVYSITNIGRRPILVTTIGGKTKGNPFIINPRSLPTMLKPGEYVIEYTPDLSIINDNLLQLFAIDSIGKYHKVRKRVLKSLINDMKKRDDSSQIQDSQSTKSTKI
jgi:hypothetical protein